MSAYGNPNRQANSTNLRQPDRRISIVQLQQERCFIIVLAFVIRYDEEAEWRLTVPLGGRPLVMLPSA